MIPSSNDFNTGKPTSSGNSFAKPAVATTSFTSNSPTTSSGTFAKVTSVSANSTSKAPVAADNHVFAGDDTTSDAYGGDNALFGELYGQDNFGGIVHMKKYRTPGAINH